MIFKVVGVDERIREMIWCRECWERSFENFASGNIADISFGIGLEVKGKD